ncbi:MAG TPA: DUF3488 and transglutaminase-like domain-containing protein [Terriglobales bacterium]
MPIPAQPESGAASKAIDRYLAIALYLLVLTGFLTLAATGGLGVGSLLVAGAALAFRGYQLAVRKTFLIPERWTTFLTIAYVAYYLVDYLLLARTFIGATVHLVVFVMLVRLYSAHRDRDYYFLTVISFLMVLAASVLTVDSMFLFAFGVFLLAAVATFILLEMRRSANKAAQFGMIASGASRQTLGISIAQASPVLAAMILLGAAAIFFLLPRISNTYFSAYASGTEIATGFNDEVQLGRIGEIQQSHALVMRVRIDGDSGGAFDLKWRGVALNFFDGRSWKNTYPRSAISLPDGRVVFVPARHGERQAASEPVHYHVLMEPLSTNVFFLAPVPLTLQGNYRAIATDTGGAVFNLDGEHQLTRYEATSNIAQPSAEELRAAPAVAPQIMRSELQLPGVDSRIPQLAAAITQSAPTNYDKALAIETYLRTHYAYTLQLPSTPLRDPVANFLFERKEGHCEYFASAMAIMLRTLQIPARLVNGFRTGEFNDVSSQYLVRASEAHSWVEVYFPGYGWVSFDPTPAGPPQAHGGLARIMLYLDAMSSFWRDWVVNYDAAHQSSLGRQVAHNGFDWYRRSQTWARRVYEQMLESARRAQQTVTQSPRRWAGAAVMITILLVVGANLGRLWQWLRRRRVAAQPQRAPAFAATIWYRRMTHIMAKRGHPKSPAQTPQEFAHSVRREPLHKAITEFTDQYERARFGNTPEAARSLPELYEQISAALR